MKTIFNTDVYDYEDEIIDNYCEANEVEREEMTIEDEYNVINDYVYLWQDDERMNLDKQMNELYLVGTLGRWDGRYTTFKRIGDNLNQILDYLGFDEMHVYEHNRNVHVNGADHDGRSTFKVRELKDDVDVYEFEDKLLGCLGDVKKFNNVVKNYTRSISQDVQEIYGW